MSGETNVFYVYEHWRPDKGEPFYVGKGQGRRARTMRGRNTRHMRIQAKLARMGLRATIHIVASGLSETAAYALEIERIANWRSAGATLCNLTNGGDGLLSPSAETRAKMRAAKVGRKQTPEHVEKVRQANLGRKLSPEHVERLRISHRGIAPRRDVIEKAALANRGRKQTPEHIEKVRKAKVGFRHTPESIAKMRLAKRGWVPSAETRERMSASALGRRASPEARAKMSAQRKGQKHSAEWVANQARAAMANRELRRQASMEIS